MKKTLLLIGLIGTLSTSFAIADNLINTHANIQKNNEATDQGSDPTKIKSGFLPIEEVPDSLALLPPPPSPSDLQFSLDKAEFEKGLLLRQTERGEQAILDADLSSPVLGSQFSEAVGVEISQETTPETFYLLKKVAYDAGDKGAKAAKDHYARIRPFEMFNIPSCTPDHEEMLSKNGSYPSGHTSLGWAYALILAEIVPDKTDDILKRGYDFGESRIICGVHWKSDVDNGRIIGSAIVAKLHTNLDFLTQLEKSKKELQSLAHSLETSSESIPELIPQ